jgi:2',3'-cyclic-nucleotide 2'-phosphodiesterase (5'-nucleotidase family)
MSAFVEETRALHKNVIVANAGDRFTGNPFNDYYKERQFPIIDLENHVGVDIATIGNHEFDYGVELLNERLKESGCIAIAANVELAGSGLNHIKPYHIFKKSGIKIAFLGVTNVDKLTGKPAVLADRVAKIQFYDPIETAVKYRFLRKQAHVFVGLTHIGLSEDFILADSMPELDVIIGAHSHTLIDEPLIYNNTLITQTSGGGKYVGKTTILVKKGVVSEINNEMINLEEWDGTEDPVVVEKIVRYEDNPFLKKPFVKLKHDFPTLESLGYMVADAALTMPGVEFSVLNCPSIRVNRLAKGAVTYADILRVYPFKNYLVIIALKPSEIRNLIEMEFTDKRNCLMLPAGFEYVAQKTSDGNIKVGKMTYPNGKKLNENKAYQVAVNNYLFSVYLHERIVDAEICPVPPTYVFDNIIEYLQNNPDVDYRNIRTRARYD